MTAVTNSTYYHICVCVQIFICYGSACIVNFVITFKVNTFNKNENIFKTCWWSWKHYAEKTNQAQIDATFLLLYGKQ